MTTVFVTLCDAGYFKKATQTIIDLRKSDRGNWSGDIVLIGVDFAPPPDFLDNYSLKFISFPRFDLREYINKLYKKRFTVPTNDSREFTKTTQWEKLHVFEPYFKQWERVVFFDAGLRVLDDVENILALDWVDKFVSPDDTLGKQHRFAVGLEMVNYPDAIKKLKEKWGVDPMGKYFLNCCWIYDTRLNIEIAEFLELLEFPVWRHNEMGVMNAILNFKHGVWSPFPEKAENGKLLFDWSELNRGLTAQWWEYCLLKYPVTIAFD
jgi:hypothetical protein